MIGQLVTLMALAVVAISPANAAPSKKIEEAKVINLGEKRPIGKGRYKEASMYVGWGDYTQPLMRIPELNKRESSIQQGPFPTDNSEIQSNPLYLHVTIDDYGSIVECGTAEPASTEAFTAHACPHLIKHAHFYPALNSDGMRVSVSGKLYVVYDITLTGKDVDSLTVVAPPSVRSSNQKEALPLKEFTPESLNLNAEVLTKMGIQHVIAALAVDKNGDVTECRLWSATFDDEIDRTLCLRASTAKFSPAINVNGNPVSASYMLSFSFGS